jgi:deazaflavin-dependent oxidoreductase (nitroreductase family)
MPTPPPPPPPGTARIRLFGVFTRLSAAAFSLTKGRIAGTFLGAPVLILHHVGRKTGTARRTPLVYIEDGPDLVVVGSRGGSDHTPSWWLNLQANPDTTVELRGGRTLHVRAEQVPEGPARERLWARAVQVFPKYELAEVRTQRRIPLIRLRAS